MEHHFRIGTWGNLIWQPCKTGYLRVQSGQNSDFTDISDKVPDWGPRYLTEMSEMSGFDSVGVLGLENPLIHEKMTWAPQGTRWQKGPETVIN